MKRIALALIAALVAVPASAQSFNCLYAKQPAEIAVCESRRLRALDHQMSKKYWAWQGQFAANRTPDLYQKDWLQRRNNCGANTACLTDAYRTRLYELENGTDDE
jgi:uncharacterized protein